MSKQTEAKERQQYTPKAIPNLCGNCANRKFDRVDTNEESAKKFPHSNIQPYFQDVNQRCGIGGFAIKKMGTCSEWTGIEK